MGVGSRELCRQQGLASVGRRRASTGGPTATSSGRRGRTCRGGAGAAARVWWWGRRVERGWRRAGGWLEAAAHGSMARGGAGGDVDG